jgi:flagellar biosynthesis protein FlhG
MRPSEAACLFPPAQVAASQPVKAIAVTSGKGGVGKTTVSINLAFSMAAMGHEVMLMDADLGLANVDVMLGLRPLRNLSHVLDGHCKLEEILLAGPGGITVVPASSGIQRLTELNEAQQRGLIDAFSELSSLTNVLIIDTSAGISDSVMRFCTAAQEVMVVVCNEPASITDAYALIKVLNQEHGISNFRVLANMVHRMQEGQMAFQKLAAVTHKFLNVSLDHIATIPYDPNIRVVAQQRRTVVEVYPESPAAWAFKKLADRTDKWPVRNNASGRIEFFVERMIQAGLSINQGTRV